MSGKISDALSMYWEVRNGFNQTPVIELAFEKSLVATKKNGYEAINGVLQLLSAHANSPQLQTPFIIANGEIFGMYNALRQYYGPEGFDAFCYSRFGVCHHFLSLDDLSAKPDVSDGLIYTLGQVEGQFADDLAQPLHEWISRYNSKHLRPHALIWGKSWKGEMFTPSLHAVTQLVQRWSRFVE